MSRRWLGTQLNTGSCLLKPSEMVTWGDSLWPRGCSCLLEETNVDQKGVEDKSSLCIFMHWWFQSVFWCEDLKYPQVASDFKASRALKLLCIFVFLAGFPICMHLTKSLPFHKHTPCMHIYPNHFALKQALWLLNYPVFQNKSVHPFLCLLVTCMLRLVQFDKQHNYDGFWLVVTALITTI